MFAHVGVFIRCTIKRLLLVYERRLLQRHFIHFIQKKIIIIHFVLLLSWIFLMSKLKSIIEEHSSGQNFENNTFILFLNVLLTGVDSGVSLQKQNSSNQLILLEIFVQCGTTFGLALFAGLACSIIKVIHSKICLPDKTEDCNSTNQDNRLVLHLIN